MFTHTADILLGKSDDFTELSTFGIMKGAPRSYIRRLTSRLTALGYVHDDGYLTATQKATDVLFGGARITIRGDKPQASQKSGRARKETVESRYALSEGLFAKLKQLRLTIAREEKVPAFVIFSDATLIDMCQKHPCTASELLTVSGVGQVKLQRYGERFLQVLCKEERAAPAAEKPPELTAELFLREFETEEQPLQITRVADNINVVLIKYGRPKISGVKLNTMLLEAGFLQTTEGVKLPTNSGEEIGITTVQRHSERGEYTQCLFGADAQRVCAELVLNEMQIYRT